MAGRTRAHPKRLVREVQRDFDDTLDQATVNNWAPKCAGQPALYMDYAGRNIPTPEEAEELCSGCPMLLLCREYAHTTKPAWGVWGGEVWYTTRGQYRGHVKVVEASVDNVYDITTIAPEPEPVVEQVVVTVSISKIAA